MKTKQIINCGYTTYNVEIEKGKSITVTREGHEPNTFLIGDWAEYNSYNLSYTGIIRQITDKTVTIEAYPGTSNSKKYRLKLDNFAWRNYDFSKAKADIHNANEMQYI